VRRAFLLALGLIAASCAPAPAGAPAELPAGRVGASIALLDDGRVAVVDPDAGSVSLLDPGTLDPLARIEVGGEPHALLPLGGRLFVANYRGGEVVVIDPASGTVQARRAVCAGPWGLAASPAGDFVVVSCEWSGSVWRLDPVTLAGGEVIAGLSRPRALVVVASDVIVADFTGGLVRRAPAAGGPLTASISLAPTSAPYRPALTAMTANLTTALVSARGQLLATHLLENHAGDRSSESVADDYGSVADDHPKINPSLSGLSLADGTLAHGGDEPVIYARYDGGGRVFSGPSAAARADAGRVLIAHESTRNVALVDLTATTPGARAIAAYAVGAGPAGVAVDTAGRVAFVDNALDRSVSRLDLAAPTAAGLTPAALTRTRPLPARYSPAALAGRKVFFDASDPHLTPSGVVACSTCHPGGGDDGLVWFIHTKDIPTKRRRTPHLANARASTAPFHWDGAEPDLPALVHATVTTLMAGDGLLVDGEAVAAYLDEIVQAPALPPGDAAAVERGRGLFASRGCAGCHAGPDGTDGQRHAALDPVSLSAGGRRHHRGRHAGPAGPLSAGALLPRRPVARPARRPHPAGRRAPPPGRRARARRGRRAPRLPADPLTLPSPAAGSCLPLARPLSPHCSLTISG
jgi:YVTN family beta-propeller protein